MKIVEIIWDDSTSESGWLDREAWEQPSTEAQSVGYLIEETKEAFSLAQSFTDELYGDVITIPKKQVKKCINLK